MFTGIFEQDISPWTLVASASGIYLVRPGIKSVTVPNLGVPKQNMAQQQGRSTSWNKCLEANIVFSPSEYIHIYHIYRPFSRLPIAIAALGYWPSSPISCIQMYSHWLQHSFPSSLSYWNHVLLCALAQPHTLFQIPSLLFLTINAHKLFGFLYPLFSPVFCCAIFV